MFDPIFDLLAGILAWFYSLVPSYGFAIIMLTVVVLVVFAPLTYKSTKSMVAMRRLQPSIKRIQRKHAGDREKMNQEMMALYQEHNVSPLSGCLPILIQSPVFIILFRIIRGITRRASTIGFSAGDALGARAQELATFVPADRPTRNFNPEYVNSDTDLYQALIQDDEMDWIGIDLSRSPIDVLADSLTTALPYLLMIVIVAVLGWYQQRQIAGRITGDISSQQQLIMRIIPWMLPIFSFTMPAGLVLYFIVSALLRVLQQAYITRTIYADEELTAPLEVDEDEDEDDDEPADDSPLTSLFGSGQRNAAGAGEARHGSRRPTSTTSRSRDRVRPPRSEPVEPKRSKASKPTKASKSTRTAKRSSEPEPTGWARAKRSARSAPTEPEKPTSKRVTPKRDTTSSNQRRKKR